MASNGWVRIHRAMMDNPMWLSEPFTRAQAWVDLLLLANHADGFIRVRGVRVPILRGQVGWSEVALAARWQWSRGKVRRFILELETVQQIEQQKNNVTSVISITNYCHYQSNNTANGTTDGQQTVQQTDSKRYTNNNGKNENNGNNDSESPAEQPPTSAGQPPATPHSVTLYPNGQILAESETFRRFWLAYPKKSGKANAAESWNRAMATGKDPEAIIYGINGEPTLCEAEEAKFLPKPSQWLDDERWLDGNRREDERKIDRGPTTPVKRVSILEQILAEDAAKAAAE